jgi:hypothetical protein
MSRGPIDLWTRTPRSIAPFSASAPSHHNLSSADFITAIAESSFQYTQHRLKGIFEYDASNNPQRRRTIVPRPDFALLTQGKVIEFLDAKYRDLWETSLPREMLYQLAIYALSKTTGVPRATILYPTLAVEAVDQVMLLKDPIFGHKRAEIVLRPVNLLKMEKLVRPRQGALVARDRQYFARTLVFGSNPETQRLASEGVYSLTHSHSLIDGS